MTKTGPHVKQLILRNKVGSKLDIEHPLISVCKSDRTTSLRQCQFYLHICINNSPPSPHTTQADVQDQHKKLHTVYFHYWGSYQWPISSSIVECSGLGQFSSNHQWGNIFINDDIFIVLDTSVTVTVPMLDEWLYKLWR